MLDRGRIPASEAEVRSVGGCGDGGNPNVGVVAVEVQTGGPPPPAKGGGGGGALSKPIPRGGGGGCCDGT